MHPHSSQKPDFAANFYGEEQSEMSSFNQGGMRGVRSPPKNNRDYRKSQDVRNHGSKKRRINVA